ncbi:hypothetical protein Cni_G06841 [Canna indica]|uniref:Uncharacterized protein n=1 Tax=Canna indica TaxID=4628 RepID=A0AAQ3JXS2_9LILI|nr:hypothetical protein Cni_G06841 [Canna indica]
MNQSLKDPHLLPARLTFLPKTATSPKTSNTISHLSNPSLFAPSLSPSLCYVPTFATSFSEICKVVAAILHIGNVEFKAEEADSSMKLIRKELGPKFKELLELGKPRLVASILAACERLETLSHECCHALSTAVNLDSESPSFIVPHILFLESYFRDKSSWKWPPYDKMHVLGCLMLQIIFRYPMVSFFMSLTSMDAAHILQIAKDARGGHVIEAFLSSYVSTKMKLKVVTKLQDHYAELAMGTASSFTVEKCFASSNMSLKENIAAELLAARAELSKTKHGPYLLKKLDIDGVITKLLFMSMSNVYHLRNLLTKSLSAFSQDDMVLVRLI